MMRVIKEAVHSTFENNQGHRYSYTDGEEPMLTRVSPNDLTNYHYAVYQGDKIWKVFYNDRMVTKFIGFDNKSDKDLLVIANTLNEIDDEFLL